MLGLESLGEGAESKDVGNTGVPPVGVASDRVSPVVLIPRNGVNEANGIGDDSMRMYRHFMI